MKVLAINDLSGFGRAALTTIIPVLAVCGHQCVPAPTAIFSAHTAFKNFRMHDLSEILDDYIEHFNELEVDFRAIYSGFLSSETQIDSVILAMKKFPSTLKIVDPVMGDEGKIYKTYTPKMCEKMRELVKYADIITPNITETLILLGHDINTEVNTNEQVLELFSKLSGLTSAKIIITGIKLTQNQISTAYFVDNEVFFYDLPKLNSYYPGTGDLFTSVLIGKILNEHNIKESIEIACNFVFEAIKYTNSLETPPLYGVEYEKILSKLC